MDKLIEERLQFPDIRQLIKKYRRGLFEVHWNHGLVTMTFNRKEEAVRPVPTSIQQYRYLAQNENDLLEMRNLLLPYEKDYVEFISQNPDHGLWRTRWNSRKVYQIDALGYPTPNDRPCSIISCPMLYKDGVWVQGESTLANYWETGGTGTTIESNETPASASPSQ